MERQGGQSQGGQEGVNLQAGLRAKKEMKECETKQQQGLPHTDPKHAGTQGPSALNIHHRQPPSLRWLTGSYSTSSWGLTSLPSTQ